jgi:hypothetical protein
VPSVLKDDYEYLISPGENSVVGNGGCGYGGMTPPGKLAIDALVKANRLALVKANRLDLIENVVRGYNPGGRVYAALALVAIEKQGSPLTDDTRATIEKIRQLDIMIDTCSGCIISHRTAKAIFESPNSF